MQIKMGISMCIAELNKFIEYAKTIIGKTNFRRLQVESIQPEIANVCNILSTGKTVPPISIFGSDDDNLEWWQH